MKKKKTRLLSWQDSNNEKPWTLCFLQFSHLPFPSVEAFSFSCYAGDLPRAHNGCRSQNSVLSQSWINSSSPEKYLAVCFPSTFWWCQRGPKRTSTKAPSVVSKQGKYSQLNPLSFTVFLTNPRTWRYVFLSFSWIWTHTHLCIWSSSDFIPIYLKVFFFSFWLRPCSVCGYLFSTSVWFWDQTVWLKLVSLQPISPGPGVVSLNC